MDVRARAVLAAEIVCRRHGERSITRAAVRNVWGIGLRKHGTHRSAAWRRASRARPLALCRQLSAWISRVSSRPDGAPGWRRSRAAASRQRSNCNLTCVPFERFTTNDLVQIRVLLVRLLAHRRHLCACRLPANNVPQCHCICWPQPHNRRYCRALSI